MTTDVNALVSAFNGMTDRESVAHQLKHWVEGMPLHNPVRDECCPDFSCCNGGNMMPPEVRQRFADAHASGDEAAQWEILSMGLGMLTADMDVNVHIAGESPVEH
jgi:hypothetical protein